MLDYTMISSIVSYHTKSLIYGMIYRRSTAYSVPWANSENEGWTTGEKLA